MSDFVENHQPFVTFLWALSFSADDNIHEITDAMKAVRNGGKNVLGTFNSSCFGGLGTNNHTVILIFDYYKIYIKFLHRSARQHSQFPQHSGCNRQDAYPKTPTNLFLRFHLKDYQWCTSQYPGSLLIMSTMSQMHLMQSEAVPRTSSMQSPSEPSWSCKIRLKVMLNFMLSNVLHSYCAVNGCIWDVICAHDTIIPRLDLKWKEFQVFETIFVGSAIPCKMLRSAMFINNESSYIIKTQIVTS